MTDVDMMLRFLLQLVVLLSACKIVGWIGRRYLGQTQVVMEMVTGVLLGPSLFGWLAPGAQEWLFPRALESGVKHPSMQVLYVVAQLGLVLYMFLVGMEFDLGLIRSRAKGAVSVSLAGVVAPFLLGFAIVELWIGNSAAYFGPGVSPHAAALYVGAAMCITAFPMLARIIYERGIAGTSMGTLALGAGATDDAAAWSMLAIVLASYKGDFTIALLAIGGGLLFAVLALTLGMRLFARLARGVERTGQVSNETFVWTMILLMLGAYVTDAIGIYAVFGAFLIGAAMPRGRFAVILRKKIEFLTVGLLLPFFFVYSGLNTELGLVNSPQLWLVAIVVLLAAIVGKGVACALAARWSGETWRDAWAIGTLMNSRGLMELIILNIGLQQKVITPTLFTIMVLMAIVTTLMASPIFKWIYQPAAATAAVPNAA